MLLRQRALLCSAGHPYLSNLRSVYSVTPVSVELPLPSVQLDSSSRDRGRATPRVEAYYLPLRTCKSTVGIYTGWSTRPTTYGRTWNHSSAIVLTKESYSTAHPITPSDLLHPAETFPKWTREKPAKSRRRGSPYITCAAESKEVEGNRVFAESSNATSANCQTMTTKPDSSILIPGKQKKKKGQTKKQKRMYKDKRMPMKSKEVEQSLSHEKKMNIEIMDKMLPTEIMTTKPDFSSLVASKLKKPQKKIDKAQKSKREKQKKYWEKKYNKTTKSKEVDQSLSHRNNMMKEIEDGNPHLEETRNPLEDNLSWNSQCRTLTQKLGSAEHAVVQGIVDLKRMFNQRLYLKYNQRKRIARSLRSPNSKDGQSLRKELERISAEIKGMQEQRKWWVWHKEVSYRLNRQTVFAGHLIRTLITALQPRSSGSDNVLSTADLIVSDLKVRFEVIELRYLDINYHLLLLLYPEPPNRYIRTAAIQQPRPPLVDAKCFAKFLTCYLHYTYVRRKIWLSTLRVRVLFLLNNNHLKALRLWLILDPCERFSKRSLQRATESWWPQTPPKPFMKTGLKERDTLADQLCMHSKQMIYETVSLIRNFQDWIRSLEPPNHEDLMPYSGTIRLRVLRALKRQQIASTWQSDRNHTLARKARVHAVSETILSGRPITGNGHLMPRDVWKPRGAAQCRHILTSAPVLNTSDLVSKHLVGPLSANMGIGRGVTRCDAGELAVSTYSSMTGKSCNADYNSHGNTVMTLGQNKDGDSDNQPREGMSDAADSGNRAETDVSKMDAETVPEEHTPLSFQIPQEELQAAMRASKDSAASFWRHDLFRGPNNEKIFVHYCHSFEVAKRVAKHFLEEKVLGFDIEWRANASSNDGIKDNTSLIQLSCENRIALFHVSLYKGSTPEELIPPTLKAILESPGILKVGVCIKGDCTRLRKYLDVHVRGQLELSHLYRLVQYSVDQPKLVNRNPVSMKIQAGELLQLPLEKNTTVQVSDWKKPLVRDQIMYAATDAYAGFRLFHVLEGKRKKMVPMPPRPEFAELDRPIKFPARLGIAAQEPAIDEELAISEELEAEDVEEYQTAAEELDDSDIDKISEEVSIDNLDSSDDLDAEYQPPPTRRVGRIRLPKPLPVDPGYPILPKFPAESTSGLNSSASDTTPTVLADSIDDLHLTTPQLPNRPTTKHPSPEYIHASTWAQSHLTSSLPCATPINKPFPSCPHATLRDFRAYHLWHHQHMSLEAVASHLRDPPLVLSTVANYILSAILLERLPCEVERLKKVWSVVPSQMRRGRYRVLGERLGLGE